MENRFLTTFHTSCGKVCGQIPINVAKLLIYLDFYRIAHASGAALNSSRTFVCIHETEFPTSKSRSTLPRIDSFAFSLRSFLRAASAPHHRGQCWAAVVRR